MRLLLSLIVVLVSSFPAFGSQVLKLNGSGGYVLDQSNRWSIFDVINNQSLNWTPIGDELSLGLKEDVIWVRLAMPKQSEIGDHQAVLHLSNSLLNNINIFLVKERQILAETSLGDHTPIVSKEIPVSDLYWPLPETWKQASFIYARIQSDSFIQSHFRILSTPQTVATHGARYWWLGIFYGALFIMAIYNLFLYSQVKDVRYIYYVGYVVSIGLFHSTMDSLPYYVFSDLYVLIDRMSVYYVDLANIFALLFVIKFLEIRDKFQLRALNTLMYTFFVAMVVEFLNGGNLSTIYSMSMSVVSALSIGYITFYSWIRGNQQARYLALAWAVLLISTPIYVLALNGVIPNNVYTMNSVRLGVILEVALISFSLAHRITLLRQDRLELQRRLNKELGAMVKARTTELEKANQKLQELSETDSLTQLKNRSYFNHSINEELARAQRNGSTLSLLIADLDHFKSINDDYGHNAGDYCLKHFAKVLETRLTRATDVPCRYGGEEFIALLPETDLKGALKVAESIRIGAEDSHISFEGQQIDLTVSIGVLSSPALSTWTSSDWTGRADKALYFAKKRRNQVAYTDPQGHLTFLDNIDDIE